MKSYPLAHLFLALTVSHIDFIDNVQDKSKTTLLIEYSDGSTDSLIIDKKQLTDKNEKQIVKQAMEIINLRIKKDSYVPNEKEEDPD